VELPYNIRILRRDDMKQGLVILLVLLAAGFAGAADVSNDLESRLGRMIAVKTAGGGVFRGELLSVTETRVELVNSDGTITSLSRKMVKSAEEIATDSKGNLYFQDSAANRLIFMPTAFGMDKGEFHIAAHELVLINGAYGFSEHFSLWSGITFLGAVLNARGSITLSPKTALSAGIFTGLSWMKPLTAGVIPYAILSCGTENRNFTIGFGLPAGTFQIVTYPTNQNAQAIFGARQTRVVGAASVIAGKIPLSPTTALISENWFIVPWDAKTWDTELMVIPMIAFRIAGPRLSWDIGAIVPLSISSKGVRSLMESDTIFPFPLLSLTYRIN
jgi:hypothetical protein